MPVIPATELFDAAFLESLAHLHLHARRVARGGRHAEQRSRDLGSGIEFKDFRAYVPGDDFRAIDWTIFRRLGRVFLRLFEELEDLPVYLLPDISRSMYVEDPPRATSGLRAALALTSISLNQHDSVGLFPFSTELKVAIRPRSGKASFMRFARTMVDFEPGGETNLALSLRKLNALRLREGLCVIVSDFFDPSGAKGVTAALSTVRHKLLLVQLVRASDRNPGLSGDLQLRDCESGAVEDVSATPRVLARYQEAYDRFQATIVNFARARNVGLLQLDVEQDVLPQLATLFETGSYTV